MAATGQAAIHLMSRTFVVTVSPDPLARFAAGFALAAAPAGCVLAWAATSPGEIAHSDWPTHLSIGTTLVLFVLLVLSLFRGTARAQLFADNELVDTIQWSLRPPRSLSVSFDSHKFEATLNTGGEREVSFKLDGGAIRSVKIQ